MRRLAALALLGSVVAAPAPFAVGGESFTQAEIVDARAVPKLEGGTSVFVTLTPAAGERLRRVSAANVGRPIALRVEGTVVAEPYIAEPIMGGRVELSLKHSLAEAEALAKRLSGKDPVPEDLGE